MSHLSTEVSVVQHILVCDQCLEERTYSVPSMEPFDPRDEGWLIFGDPRWLDIVDKPVPGTVTFHTQRCAIGFFRTLVREASHHVATAGAPEPVVDEKPKRGRPLIEVLADDPVLSDPVDPA